MNPIVALLVEKGIDLLSNLALDASEDVREMALNVVHKKYIEAQDTPGILDDLGWGIVQDTLHMLEKDPGYKPVIDDECKEALYVLYYKAKNTPNPGDDLLVGTIFKILGMETPTEK